MAGKMMLVFDCQEMPKDVKAFFFDRYGEGKSNDVFVTVYAEGDCDGDCPTVDCDCEVCGKRTYNIVEQWLRDNGSKDDEVIVKR